MDKRKKTGGRAKGSQNKVSVCARTNVLEVFEMLGGAKGFHQWAIENQTEFYRHYSKLIPTTATHDVTLEGKINVNVKFD